MLSAYISLVKSVFHLTVGRGLVLDWLDRENFVQGTFIEKKNQ